MAIYPQNWWKVVLDSLNVALGKFIPLGWVVQSWVKITQGQFEI